MGVSRSATIVLAYLMKELDWSYTTALDFVRAKRARVQPNDAFRQQLLMYESMLNGLRRTSKLFNSATTGQPHHSSSSYSSTRQKPSRVSSGGSGITLTRSNSLRQLMIGDSSSNRSSTSGGGGASGTVSWSRQLRSSENATMGVSVASGPATNITPTNVIKRVVGQTMLKNSAHLVSPTAAAATFSLHDATNMDEKTPKMCIPATSTSTVITRQHSSWSSSSSTASQLRRCEQRTANNRASMPAITSTTTPISTFAGPHRSDAIPTPLSSQTTLVSLIGNVKQQVESINGQSRPCLVDNDDTEVDNASKANLASAIAATEPHSAELKCRIAEDVTRCIIPYWANTFDHFRP